MRRFSLPFLWVFSSPFAVASWLSVAALGYAETPENAIWDLKKLSEAPAYHWVDQQSPVHALSYTGEPFKGKPTQVFAYFATPETVKGSSQPPSGKLPGIVLIHGGGGTAFKVWAELWAKRGYVAIAMDLAGMRPDEKDNKVRTRWLDGGPDQSHIAKFDTIRTEDRSDDWPYHAVSNAILAHSLIRSLPYVDADRTAVTGISWGGYTTCIVASVDNRFKAAVPIYGCGFLQEHSSWLGEFLKLGPELTAKWVKEYDPGSHLPRCSVPIFFVNGTNDAHYWLNSYMKSFNVVTQAPKNIRIEVKMPHGHEVGWKPLEIGLFIDSKLGVNGENPLPVIKDLPSVASEKATARVQHQTALTKAAFVYAQPGGDVNKREWTTVPAEIKGDDLSASAPPAGTDMYFFTVTDERGAMVSSPLWEEKR